MALSREQASDPSRRRSAPPPRPSPEQMAEWEARLQAEDLGVEKGEGIDKGAEALRRQVMEETLGPKAKDLYERMLQYWITRNPLSTWGDHKQTADQLASVFEIEPLIANELMKDLEDETARAQATALQLVFNRVNGREHILTSRPEVIVRAVTDDLCKAFPSYSRTVCSLLAERAIDSSTKPQAPVVSSTRSYPKRSRSSDTPSWVGRDGD